jgi:MoaD family protein
LPKIKLFANLRITAGQKEISITGSTLNSILNDLVQQVPALDEAIFENGQIRPHLIITTNGQNTTDPKMVVAEQDTIAIFPPIAGG